MNNLKNILVYNSDNMIFEYEIFITDAPKEAIFDFIYNLEKYEIGTDETEKIINEFDEKYIYHIFSDSENTIGLTFDDVTRLTEFNMIIDLSDIQELIEKENEIKNKYVR